MEDKLTRFLDIKQQIERKPFAKKNISAQKHEGLKYLQYRLMRPFLKMDYLRYQKRNPTLPWLAPDAIYLLDQLLDGGKGLEFGSGRSTLFFSGMVEQLDSVEHHEAWYHKVNESLSKKGIENTTLHFLPAEEVFEMPDLSSEEQIFLTTEKFPVKDEIFLAYTGILDSFEDESLDFILVDGRARRTCALKAGQKLKPNGLLVLDNSERVRYQEVHEQYKNYPSIVTTTGLTDTTIWIKA